MVYNPLDVVVFQDPDAESDQTEEQKTAEFKELQQAAMGNADGVRARYIISVDDLLDEDRYEFWTAKETIRSIEQTEQKLREQLSDDDEKRRLRETKEGITIEAEIDLEKAMELGDKSSYYQQVANNLFAKALSVANTVTAYRGTEREMVAARVVDEFLGLGPIEPLTRDPLITEIMVNGFDKVFFERDGQVYQARAANFRSQEHTNTVATRFLRAINKSVSATTPLVDGQLADGSRVNVIHPSLSDGETVITIRRFPNKTWTLMDLIEKGAMPEEMALDLARLVEGRASVLVVGGTGSGKALDVSTPIPTPNGFVAMGDLKVGDLVFDETGQPTTVIGAYETEHDRPCYEVTFSDGSSIVADAEHLWLTDTRSSRRALSRQERSNRKRATAIPEGDLKALSDLATALPSDFSATVADLNRRLGWTDSSKMSRLYSTAQQMTPVAQDSKAKFYLAQELLNAAVVRFSKPWHDQREASGTAAVRTTSEIRETLLTPSGHRNHSVAVAGVVQYPERDLPVDPYVLGVWLGDGDKNSGRWYGIDHEIADRVVAAGYEVKSSKDNRPGKHPNYRSWRAHGLQAQLRELGVLGNKHIPFSYLYASEEQRRELLAGLLDTDGSATKQGGVEFYNSDFDLAQAVYTLVASLGYKVTLREKKSQAGDISYTVAFKGIGGEFRLERKNSILARAASQSRGTQAHRASHRYIVSVEPVASRPVRCIRVANDSHLFLAGTAYIPTHNTTLLNAASGCIPTSERIVTVEDSRELRLHPDADNVIHLQARRGTEKVEEINMQRLVKNALRMRPDRIIVGETRSAEVIDYLQACSTGHEGSMSTIHANSPQETMTRINLLIAQSGVSLNQADVMDAIGLAIDMIVFAKRFPDGARRITEMAELHYDEEKHTIKAVPIWRWSEENNRHERLGEFSDKLLTRFNQYAPVPINRADLENIAAAARKADAERLKALMEGRVT